MTIKTKASTCIILDIILIGFGFCINLYIGLFLLIIYIIGMKLLRNRIKNIYFTKPEQPIDEYDFDDAINYVNQEYLEDESI